MRHALALAAGLAFLVAGTAAPALAQTGLPTSESGSNATDTKPAGKMSSGKPGKKAPRKSNKKRM